MSENKDLKAKADKCLRLIKTAKKSIHVPNEAKPKKEIIDDITNSLDKDILRQVKEAIDNFPCLLLIGNEDKGSLAACYAHCNRDIDYYGNFINKYKQRLEEQGKYSPYIHGLDIHNNTFFEYVPCFSYNLLPFEYVDKFKRLTDLFSKGYTVFLDRLELESEDEDDGYTFKSFIGSLKDARANMPTGSSGLFIISIDRESDLPGYFRGELTPVLLDGEEAVVEPVKDTIEQEKKAEREKVKEKLSKPLAYIRLDDNDDMFYVKAKNDTEEVPLNLSPKSQEYKLLLHLYNIYGSKNSKASSEDLLIVCDIQNHEKGESVDEKKINHLRKIVSDVRTALEKAGLKRGHLKYEYKVDDKNRVEKDECCLLIHCSPK